MSRCSIDNIFDFNLIIYRSYDSKKDWKIDKNIKIELLEKADLLKVYKNSLLYISDSRNFNYIYNDYDTVKKTYESILSNTKEKYINSINQIYKSYLPRTNSAFLNKFTINDSIDYYKSKKRLIRTFNKLTMNPLINIDDFSPDWFIYNEENCAFLMNYEHVDFTPDYSNIKLVDGKIYFQDKLPYIMFMNNEFKTFIVEVQPEDKVSI